MLLLLLGVALAVWAGGRVSFDFGELPPGAWPYEAFVTRLVPGPAVFLLTFLISIAAVLSIARKSVILLPEPRILLCAFALWLFVALSILGSTYGHASMIEAAKWSLYLLTLLATVALCGRTTGTTALAAVIVAASGLLAIDGIAEYLSMAETEPGFRIFGGWMNPNALASVLSLAFPLSIALAARNRSDERSSISLAVFITGAVFAGLIGAAIWLTGSKGGLLCACIGLAVLLVVLLISKRGSSVARVGAATLLAVLFSVAVVNAAKPKAAATSFRSIAFQTEAAQSAGFRKTLWVDTVSMIKARPIAGWGAGAFSAAFPKFSSTEGSKLTHQSYLQLAAESGVLSLFALVALAVMWLAHLFKRHPAADDSGTLLRAGTVGGVFAGAGNCMFESSLSYPGFGVVFFALLGIGLALSADGARSDKLPSSARTVFVGALAAIASCISFFAAVSEVKLQEGIYHLSAGQLSEARKSFDAAKASAPLFAPAHSFSASAAFSEGDFDGALANQRAACSLLPSSANFLRLAEMLSQHGEPSEAEEAFQKAVTSAPNSPKPLAMLLKFQIAQKQSEKARETAQQLIAMENSKYFTLRALPEYVYLDTIEARLYLADQALSVDDVETEVRMVSGAFDILEKYVTTTYIFLKTKHDQVAKSPGFSEQEFASTVIGRQFEESKRVRAQFGEVGARLVQLYRDRGRTDEAEHVMKRISAAESSN